MRFRSGDEVVVTDQDHRMFGKVGRVTDNAVRSLSYTRLAIEFPGASVWSIWHEGLAPADAVTRLGLLGEQDGAR